MTDISTLCFDARPKIFNRITTFLFSRLTLQGYRRSLPSPFERSSSRYLVTFCVIGEISKADFVARAGEGSIRNFWVQSTHNCADGTVLETFLGFWEKLFLKIEYNANIGLDGQFQRGENEFKGK